MLLRKNVLTTSLLQLSLCSVDNSSTQSVGATSLALRLEHAIKKCITIQRGKALQTKHETLLQGQDNLEKLMESEWGDKVSSHLLEKLTKHLLGRTVVLTEKVSKKTTP